MTARDPRAAGSRLRCWLAGAAAIATVGAAASGGGGQGALDGTSSGGLVFVRVVAGVPDIARVRISDGTVRAVTTTPERTERWPYWSNAARRLLYQVGPQNAFTGPSDLALWDPVTERESLLLEISRFREPWPCWSPDGRRIVFTRDESLAETKLTPDSVSLVAPGREDGSLIRPSFSPDGLLLVAQRRSPQDDRSKLWIFAADAPPRALTRDEVWNDIKPFFTRDGRQIVYTRRPAGGGHSEVARIDVQGGEPRTLSRGDADQHSAHPSPTRDEVAFIRDTAGDSEVLLADLDGGHARKLRDSPDWREMAPRWSPDGELLVVTAVPRDVGNVGRKKRTGIEHAHLVVLDRKGRILLDTPGAMADWMPAWQ